MSGSPSPPSARPNRGPAWHVTRAKVEAMKSELAHAQGALDAALQSIEAAPRAEKVTISEAVRTAFQDLQKVRDGLNDLEALLRREEEPE